MTIVLKIEFPFATKNQMAKKMEVENLEQWILNEIQSNLEWSTGYSVNVRMIDSDDDKYSWRDE